MPKSEKYLATISCRTGAEGGFTLGTSLSLYNGHMWIDTHCHLSAPEFSADCGEIWQAARAAGVSGALLPAVNQADSQAVAELAARLPGCVPAFGIHPCFVAHEKDEGKTLAELDELLAKKPPVAVGEIGLDNFGEIADSALQERFFLAQLKLAKKHDLPVILHVRRAADAVLKGLRQIRVKGGIAHAFNGSAQQAEGFLKLGFKLGFGGSLTYLGSRRIRALAASLPIDAIVLETDAPDIPPVWLSGQGHKPRNTPAEIARIGETLANLRGMDVETLAAHTRANAFAVLPGFEQRITV